MLIEKGSRVFINDRQDEIVFDRTTIVLSEGALLENCSLDRCVFEFRDNSNDIVFQDCNLLNCRPTRGQFINCSFME